MNYYYPPPNIYPEMYPPPNMSVDGYAPPVPLPTNRYIYVNKQSFMPPPGPAPTCKVLINPHFKKTVFVNPKFNPPKIHVNPNVLRQIKPPEEPPKTTVINTRNKLIRVPNAQLNTNKATTNLGKAVINTRNKIIRISSDQLAKRKRSLNVIESPSMKRPRSLHTKYKIVRTSTPKKRSNVIVTKYKITKVTPHITKPVPTIKKSPKRKFLYVDRFLPMSTMAKNVVLKQNSKLLSASFVNINGILYKKSPNSLQKTGSTKTVSKATAASPVNPKHKIIQKKIVRLSTSNTSKSSSTHDRSLVKKYKIIRSRRNASKMKKCNIPCVAYRRTGKCKAKDEGKCNKVHNPNQIILCTRFLQGACTKDSCPLSHKVSQEKMPTCKFFLEGLCFKDNCPYLHVKISPKADICRDFLEGFCQKGAECNKRHQFLCPDYEKTKSCPRKRCPYPHGNVVRKRKVFKQDVAKKCSKQSVNENEKFSEDHKSRVLSNENQRYYQDKDSELEAEVMVDKNIIGKGKDRPKLGTLPVFIPFI